MTKIYSIAQWVCTKTTPGEQNPFGEFGMVSKLARDIVWGVSGEVMKWTAWFGAKKA